MQKYLKEERNVLDWVVISSRGWPGKYSHVVDKTVTGTKQRKEKLSRWLCQKVPRLNICFWVLSENVLERGQYLNYWAEEKECDLSSANGLHSAEGLDPRAGLWFSHSWFSSFALGLNYTNSSPGSRAHTLMTERISLSPYCMTQLLIISYFSSISYWFSCSRELLHRSMYHRTEKLRMR